MKAPRYQASGSIENTRSFGKHPAAASAVFQAMAHLATSSTLRAALSTLEARSACANALEPPALRSHLAKHRCPFWAALGNPSSPANQQASCHPLAACPSMHPAARQKHDSRNALATVGHTARVDLRGPRRPALQVAHHA